MNGNMNDKMDDVEMKWVDGWIFDGENGWMKNEDEWEYDGEK